MPASIWYPQFRDEQNSGSLYPFMDSATLVTNEGYSLDRDAFLDAILYPPGTTNGLSLITITITGDDAIFAVGLPGQTPLATARSTLNNLVSPLNFVDPYDRPAGLILFDADRLSALQGWPEGVFTFPAGSAPFLARCLVPQPNLSLDGVVVDGAVQTGELWFVGGDGVQLSVEGDAIRIDIVGEPLSSRARCEERTGVQFEAPRFLKTITVRDDAENSYTITPDAYGNIAIIPAACSRSDTILRIIGKNSGIHFEAAG